MKFLLTTSRGKAGLVLLRCQRVSGWGLGFWVEVLGFGLRAFSVQGTGFKVRQGATLFQTMSSETIVVGGL